MMDQNLHMVTAHDYGLWELRVNVAEHIIFTN